MGVTHLLDKVVNLADRVVLLTDHPLRVSDVLRVALERSELDAAG